MCDQTEKLYAIVHALKKHEKKIEFKIVLIAKMYVISVAMEMV